MMLIIYPTLFALAESLRSKYNRVFFRRKTGEKSTSPKNASQFSRKSVFSPKLPGLPGLRFASLAAGLAAFLLLAADASAAEVVTKEQGLEGSVVGVTAEGVEFETIYGKGTILIQWSDIEIIRSDKEFLVLYGEDEEAKGRIWGLENGKLIVGESRATAARIPVGAIHHSVTREQYEKSRLERLRARYRYWTANFDLAFALTRATTDTSSFSTSLELRRKKTPTDFTFGAYYFYGTSKASGESSVTTENRLLGRTRLDRDISERTFAFGQISAEYDEIQSLSLRTDPVVGVGYRFIKREKLSVSGRMGPGYVYQRYFGGETDDYFTILFGGNLEADLPYGSKLKWGAEYLPAVTNWESNYLIRTFASWTMPIIGMLDFKIAVFETYNNQPPADTDRNTFTTTAGISLRF
jgi:putative salt-induced outer membrane protein YdiY